jgi:ribosome maturation factor RimP
MPKQAPEALVRELVAAALEADGIALLGVSWHPGGRNSVLRVTVDRPGGISIDECGLASQLVSAILDQHEELFPPAYSLEVSSPGAERDLATEADYRAALGRRVRLHLAAGDSEQVLEGRLVSLSDEELGLETRRGRSGRLVGTMVERERVVRARVVVDL